MAQSSSDKSLLELELRLFRCSLSPSPSLATTTTPNNLLVLIESVVQSIEKGDYLAPLSSDAARLLFNSVDSIPVDSPTKFYSQLDQNIDSFLLQNADDKSSRALLLMSIAVSAFLAFTQTNLTGPCEGGFPSFPLPFLSDKDVSSEWDIWARNQLMSSTGSDLLAKYSLPQYILYAKMLLMKTRDISWQGNSSSLVGTRSVSWWLSRFLLLQQRILEESTSTLFDLLQVLMAETLDHFGKLEGITSYWGSNLHEGEAATIVSMAYLEAGIIEYTYSRVDHARQHFNTAEEASGLQLSVTGVLGFRTIHQVDATPQRVLVTNTIMPQIGDVGLAGRPKIYRNVTDNCSEDNLCSHSTETSEVSDILMTPKLVENGEDADNNQNRVNATVPLKAIQQAVILARCLLIEKDNPYGEMKRWDMAPFIEAVDAQQYSYYIIQCFCDILRVRWERSRSRTKERALLMMNKLVQSAYESSPGAAERVHYSYGVYVPTTPALRKEYAEQLVSCGMIGEALKIFEDLELWDNLIHCYSLLDKKAVAIELIKACLSKTPNDPRLWCSLGDVTNTDSYYEKALEVSNDRSARAKRSLARSAYNRGEYEASKVLWESAMALNSLFPDGWFALGAAALKARDVSKALDGFTHAVQLDPDNGEAWNNIACLHMVKKKNKEAFIAFKEALKYRRNSWQLWDNYSQVAVDIRNFGQALEGTKMVLDLTNNKRVNTNLLETVLIEIESQISKHNTDPNCRIQTHPNDPLNDSVVSKYSTLALSRETDLLVEVLGKLLQQVVRSGKAEDVWGLYARWHKIKGDLTMCSEALLKQVRAYQGLDSWSNRDRFKKLASASLQLCEVYMEISLSTRSRRELNSAEMLLRNTIKQAASFSELEEFRSLEACLDDVIQKSIMLDANFEMELRKMYLKCFSRLSDGSSELKRWYLDRQGGVAADHTKVNPSCCSPLCATQVHEASNLSRDTRKWDARHVNLYHSIQL